LPGGGLGFIAPPIAAKSRPLFLPKAFWHRSGASEIDLMEWLFDLLMSNNAAVLFIAIVGTSVCAITWRLYQD
jgi:hypothetical protein